MHRQVYKEWTRAPFYNMCKLNTTACSTSSSDRTVRTVRTNKKYATSLEAHAHIRPHELVQEVTAAAAAAAAAAATGPGALSLQAGRHGELDLAHWRRRTTR